MNTLESNDLIQFLKLCADAISENIANIDDSDDRVIEEGIAEFRLKLENAISRDFTQAPLAVIDKLASVADSPFTFNFQDIVTDLKWRPSPRTDPDAKVIALSSLNEILNLGDFLAGFMFMSPNQIYPEHKHPPQEVYFVLSGTASWLYGGEETYRQQKPGDIIYNHPRDLHGMKTQNESLLALYFLWGNKTKGYSY